MVACYPTEEQTSISPRTEGRTRASLCEQVSSNSGLLLAVLIWLLATGAEAWCDRIDAGAVEPSGKLKRIHAGTEFLQVAVIFCLLGWKVSAVLDRFGSWII